jgi:CubicO group peptidase (beta-lactamase class C family)
MDFGSFREIARGSSLLYVEFCPLKNSLWGDCMRNSRGLFLALSLLFSCTVLAQEPQPPVSIVPKKSSEQAAVQTPTSNPQIAHPLDAVDLGAFFDGVIPLQLERADIAGASVLVMKDGKLLLQKGYGFADAKQQKPVDPAATIFRLASISKLFTWVSVMQLQEQGKLDLDTDVNNYLDFEIRPAFDKPITLRNLMTHTGGFEEEARDILLIKAKKSPTLRDFLIENQPRRLFPPGTIPAYSNYGVGIASYLVQRISGQPFEQYVSEHVFAPLAMTHSSFDQPLPQELEKLPAAGYRGNTEKPALGFEIFTPAGAGGISSTASDMGRFGQALLNGGQLDGKRILKTETLNAMYTPQFRASNQLPPICMGFYETWRNDLRWIGHEGDLIAFHSLFFLERSQKLILFVSFNSASAAGKVRPELVQMFSDRYFPSNQKQKFVNESREELKAIAGTYQSTRRADSTKVRLISLMSQRTAKLDKDGVLEMEGVNDLRGHTMKWKPIGKDLLQQVDGQHLLFAIRDGNGKVLRLAADFPGVQAERVRWYEKSKIVFFAAGLSLLALFSVVFAALSRTIRRLLLRNRPRPAPQPATRWLPFTTQIAAWIWVVLLSTIFAVLAAAGDDLAPPTKAWDKYFYLINAITAVAIFFSVLAIFSGLLAWLRNDLRAITKVKFSLVALACLFLMWFAIHWNIIGPATRL